MTPVRILILGTGGMARKHVEEYKLLEGVELVAGVDNDPDRLATFLETHAIPRGFTSLDEALAWDGFDAVSNVTPDSVHYATTLPLLAAGKHVLCEKPLAVNHAHAEEMAHKASLAGVINMVNLSFRPTDALETAARMVREGAIGSVRHFDAAYLQSWLTQSAWGDWRTDPKWLWRLSTAHGSNGVLGDVGVHILDYATHAIGSDPARVSCRLTTFDKAPDGKIGDYTLDANDSAVMHLSLENGASGVIHATRFASGHLNELTLKIYGTTGALGVTFSYETSTLRGCLGEDNLTQTWRDLPLDDAVNNYQRFVEAVRSGVPVEPSFARGAVLQKVLDAAVASSRDDCRDVVI